MKGLRPDRCGAGAASCFARRRAVWISRSSTEGSAALTGCAGAGDALELDALPAPIVDEAVKEQIDRLTITSINHELEIELAEELVRTIPSAEMVRYAKCGGEAITASRLTSSFFSRISLPITSFLILICLAAAPAPEAGLRWLELRVTRP